MSRRSVILLGGPDSGKTNYIGRLWPALDAKSGSLVAAAQPREIGFVLDTAEHLFQGHFAPRTEHADDRRDFEVVVAPATGGDETSIIIPDISGELWRTAVIDSEIADDWMAELRRADGALLFVRVGSDQDVRPLDWVTSRKLLAKIGQDEDRNKLPSQVMLCELIRYLELTMANRPDGTRPRLSLVVSAWDRVNTATFDKGPNAYLMSEHPLLAGRLQDTHRLDVRTFGLSVVGGDLKDDAGFRDEFLEGGLDQHGWVAKYDPEARRWLRDTESHAAGSVGRRRLSDTLITIDAQLHGYRQGHQLLSFSTSLPKADQSIIDRLSDMAGPLRPGETFQPYLSAYPLPTGQHYVLARTWQDLTVPRAGCVRTLSLLIPASIWESASGLKPLFDLLDPESFPSTAEPLTLSGTPASPIPPAPAFRANELLEALFLEDPKPVAIFDAPSPELISLRLLTALWPSLRSRFALSTLALSPRKIEGRGFDLVFAPKDARARFASWPGRRIDARTGQGARHRWTGAIVDRVFNEPNPRLLGERELRLIGTDESNTPAALRIALLWDELLANLGRSPSAALGLLDIFNSRMQSDPETILALQPALADAAHRAVTSLPAPEAWDFIGAMARKIHGTRLASAAPSVATAAGLLAGRSPSGAIGLLDQPDPQEAIQALTPRISEGLNDHFDSSVEVALANARPETLARLIEADEKLTKTIVAKPVLIERLAKILPELSTSMLTAVREAVLPFLIYDAQIAAARPLLASLDSEALNAEVHHLADANRFEAASFIVPLAERARQLRAIGRLRETLLGISASPGRDQFLRATLTTEVDDIRWLMEEPRLEAATAERFLVEVLREANDEQFRNLLSHGSAAQAVLDRLSISAADILLRAVNEVQLPLAVHVETVKRLIPTSPDRQKADLARKALDRCLGEHFAGDEVATISMLLGAVGQALDGGWAARRGLEKGVAASVVNRNLLAFHGAPKAARLRIVGAIEDVAQALSGRYAIELDERAANACAQIFWDAQSVDAGGLLRAAGRLLPMLLRSQRVPVSAIVAATFPFVYRELAKEDDVPELLKFVPFFDWDRCKAARRELVDAFLASTAWKPSDLALTACRASDVGKILKRTAKAYGGETYIDRIFADLSELPEPCREQAKRTVAHIRSDWPVRYDWRD